ncbi:MAG: hypothetical protein J0I17_06365 ['Candidatus Kapabacteria' thiocyanatum]|uniref:DNA ligase (ATP) n=1 Tax=Candidatus Kapaibacterium thiocyanatum TaxID=1895771 RepID=A0A1M3L6K5_9BACT|nr:hypothetical protein ['Candidatus Kapabacteria' thiocyanatum]OJX61195.1 MAG: hypothetical protein BGO89_00990 ['Candidatus Kapabacteria' thiocyanatum]
MNLFARLYDDLDGTTDDRRRHALLKDYFDTAHRSDIPHALLLMLGYRGKRRIALTALREIAIDDASVPEWLFEECQTAVGDLAETIALVIPTGVKDGTTSLHDLLAAIDSFQEHSDMDVKAWIRERWHRMNPSERIVFNKLLTGTFRFDVGRGSVVRALSESTGTDIATLTMRLAGMTTALPYEELIAVDETIRSNARYYPFAEPTRLEGQIDDLGDVKDWFIEHTYDGRRVQIVMREGSLYVWTTDGELVTDRYPMLDSLRYEMDGIRSIVLDGTIVPMKDGHIVSAHTPDGKVSSDGASVFMASDILEYDGIDTRHLPCSQRRALLGRQRGDIVALSVILPSSSWNDVRLHHAQARTHHAAGLSLRRISSAYGEMEPASWLFWKNRALSIRAVLLYTQLNNQTGRSEIYTFAVWRDGELVSVAKTAADVPDGFGIDVETFIRSNTIERIGPIRTVKPELVFDIGFDTIRRSARHKSGVSVSAPRILAWHRDMSIDEADTLDDILALLIQH